MIIRNSENSFLEKKELKINSLNKKESVDAKDEAKWLQVIQRSRHNIKSIKERLGTLTPEEKNLYKRLVSKHYFLHHAESCDFNKDDKDSKSESFSTSQPLSLGTEKYSIPYFGQEPSKKTAKSDFVLIQMDYDKVATKSDMWCKGNPSIFEQIHDEDFVPPSFTIGKTTVSWELDCESPLSSDEAYVKILVFSEKGKEIHRLRLGMQDEVAAGSELLPFLAYSLIERIRYLDPGVAQFITEHPSDDTIVNKLFDLFFSSPELEYHFRSSLLLDKRFFEKITPEQRKKMALDVNHAAAKGDIETLEKYHQAGYPMEGFFYQDPFYQMASSYFDLPIFSAIKAKQHKSIVWFFDQNVSLECFSYSSNKLLPFRKDNAYIIEKIESLLSAAVSTMDKALIKLLLEDMGLRINANFDSSDFQLFKEKATKMNKRDSSKLFSSSVEEKPYDSRTIDLVYKSLLSVKSLDPTIYDYVSSKLHFCQEPDFLERELFDIASFGSAEQLERYMKKPDYEKQVLRLYKQAYFNNNDSIMFAIGKNDSQWCLKQLIDVLNRTIFNLEYADQLVKQMKLCDRPKELRSLIKDETIYSSLILRNPYRQAKEKIQQKIDWMIKKLNIKPDEMIVNEVKESLNLVVACCHAGLFDKAKEFIEKGAPAHYEEFDTENDDHSFFNPIYYALTHGATDFAKYLLDVKKVPLPTSSKLLVDIIHSRSLSTLQFAYSRMDILKSLHWHDQPKALDLAIKLGELEMADILRQHGLPFYGQKKMEYRLLQCVETSKNIASVEWLNNKKLMKMDDLSIDELFYGMVDSEGESENHFLLLQWLHEKQCKEMDNILLQLFMERYPKETLIFCERNSIDFFGIQLNRLTEKSFWENIPDVLFGLIPSAPDFMYVYKKLKEAAPDFMDKIDFYLKSDIPPILSRLLMEATRSHRDAYLIIKGLLLMHPDQSVLDSALISVQHAQTKFGQSRSKAIQLLKEAGAKTITYDKPSIKNETDEKKKDEILLSRGIFSDDQTVRHRFGV